MNTAAATRVIDTSGAISQLPFKASMTRGYASDLRNQGQWYMNEADRIENGTSATWSSSRGDLRQRGRRQQRRSPGRAANADRVRPTRTMSAAMSWSKARPASRPGRSPTTI
jgi:conjugal transfer mating pair stabilization protein TraG